MKEKTAALLIGFGGPQNPGEVRPFLESVLEGVSIPPQRFDEVLGHYEALGGVSPYNAVSHRQKEALERWLASQRSPLQVGVGFRHSKPAFREAFETFKKYEVKKVVGFVLASFRSYPSFEKYRLKVSEARQLAGAEDIEVVYTDPFGGHPLYLEAQLEKVRETMRSFSDAPAHETYFVFTAHSIPVAYAGSRGYAAEFSEAGAWIAARLGLSTNWSVAYQSRSGDPREPWLEPDIRETLRHLDDNKYKRVLVIPVGFLCDNAEVIYDLDIEVKALCERAGLEYFRASTVTDHPKFIEMMGRQILEKA